MQHRRRLLQELPDLQGEGARYRQRLEDAICGRPGIGELATNPVMLTCLCVIHWNQHRLPEGRALVYQAVVHWLLASRWEQRAAQGFPERFAEQALAQLALALTDDRRGKQAVCDLSAAIAAVEPVFERRFPELSAADRRHRAGEWLDFEFLGSGLIEEVAGRRLRFWHLTFQEYLAALQLSWLEDRKTGRDAWWPVVRRHLDDPQWRETIEFFPACLYERGEGRVTALLERVLALRGEAPDLAREAWVAGVAGRLLEPVAAYYKLRPELAAVYRRALEAARGLFTREGAAGVPVAVRIAAAEALGRAGDPRLAPEQDNLLPVAGVAGLRLGKYPVTVDELRLFVEGGGYEERRFWQEAGWEVRERNGWNGPEDWAAQLKVPNRPVVGVSWWEADAYCRWLSWRRGFELRLPAQAEWEAAARPASGEYPWGEEAPDEERANFGGNVGAPTPVGIYPSGDGPSGHCDLAGNVWEWCADRVEIPGIDEEIRALRGGCWWNSAVLLRSAIRFWDPAWNRSVVIGVRVAAAPASP